MQWVVTTGRTVEEARTRAVVALGIDDTDLEWEVLDEPHSSLFGLRRTDARVRARVRPTRPRPKVDRRNRRKTAPRGGRRRKSTRAGSSRKGADAAPAEEQTDRQRPARRQRDRSGDDRQRPDRDTPAPARPGEAPRSGVPSGARDRIDTDSDQSPAGTSRAEASGATMSDIPLAEQEPTAVGFVEGLLDAFDAEADVASAVVDDDTLEITVDGDDLGLLVGQRGATLNALQELTRTAVAQQHSGRLEGRLRVDVAGYRARRKEALVRFVGQQADRVKETGSRVALEPMSPPDRKIVHDAVNEIDGVRTVSEGEDRRRHVVILPDD